MRNDDLVNINYRLLTLLGYATAIIHTTEVHDNDKKKKDWFLKAVDNVVYRSQPLPPFPENEKVNK